MLVGKNHKIESDALNITLCKREGAGWRVDGYFSSVKGALECLVLQGVKETGLRDLIAVNKRIDELSELIKGLPELVGKPAQKSNRDE